MGGKDPNRQPRVGSLLRPAPGWIRLAECVHCDHTGPLPVRQLVRKHGELCLLEFALVSIRCTECRKYGATMKMVRLCDPGCPKQRG